MASVRVLRLLEYTYPDTEAMADDMARWGVPANGEKLFGRIDRRIKSAVLPEKVIGSHAYTPKRWWVRTDRHDHLRPHHDTVTVVTQKEIKP